MTMPRSLTLTLALLVAHSTFAQGQPSSSQDRIDFTKQVQPLFARACIKCHGPEKQKGSLRLDVRDQVFQGGDSGEPAVKRGNPEASVIVKRVTSTDKSLQMPPRGDRLTEGEIALLRRWITEGAGWPADANPAGPKRAPGAMVVTEADREHWAFQPLRPVAVPPVRDESWAATPIDRFILAALERNNLTPVVPADRRTLLRRVYFDLIGVP